MTGQLATEQATGELRRAALGLAVVTVVSRLAGFARGLVFVRAVGATDVGDTYTRANTGPQHRLRDGRRRRFGQQCGAGAGRPGRRG